MIKFIILFFLLYSNFAFSDKKISNLNVNCNELSKYDTRECILLMSYVRCLKESKSVRTDRFTECRFIKEEIQKSFSKRRR